jgi:ABC-type branched-subunit amino acid transport system ATPase component/ABC-type branched-subunit amino acid transport system permease subunit
MRTLLLSGLLVWPLLPHVPYDLLNTAILATEYCVVALSLVLLIGLVGQISLCQAALVGMGAFVTALVITRTRLPFPLTLIVGTIAGAATAALIGTVALRVRGLYLAVATLIFGYLCDQYLFNQVWLVQSQSGTSIPFETIGKAGTVPFFDLADAHVFYYAALAVAVVALYGVANLRDSRIGRAFAAVRGSEVAAASLGINVVRIKLLGFACAGALAGLGGALTLVGSRTVAPDQFNFMHSLYFLGIAVVGGLRSLGGAVASSVLFALLVGEVFFRSPTLADYLDVISAGLLIGVLLFFRGGLGAIPERLPLLGARVRSAVQPIVNGVRRARVGRTPALAGGKTAGPRPLARVAGGIRRAGRRLDTLLGATVVRLDIRSGISRLMNMVGLGGRQPRAETAMGEAGTGPGVIDVVGIMGDLSDAARSDGKALHIERNDEEPAELAVAADRNGSSALRAAATDERVAGSPGPGGRREPVLLSAEHITVRFGGLTAVNDASLQVGAGEIVGLIGPNGAGKTTLFNSILGLNTPTEGRVSLFDRDVTSWGVHRRAALGVGRTFQILQLFPDLTVFDNLLVATHLQNSTGLWGGLAVTPGAQLAEAKSRQRVQAVLKLMELEEAADRRVAGLPFGMLRLIEVARTLVTGARLVCFDEPASGLDSAETEKLLEWFRFLRQIGITLLVIEHDVSFVVRLCDYIYVLDQGRLIAEGTPSHIQRDPHVISSYLGTALEEAS